MRARLKSFLKAKLSPSQQKSMSPPASIMTPKLSVDANSTSSSEGSNEDWQSVEESPPETSSDHDSTRAKDLWNKVKRRYHLVDFHALPDYLRENEFILRHYRADWPLKETLLSIFRIHNETLNIWT